MSAAPKLSNDRVREVLRDAIYGVHGIRISEQESMAQEIIDRRTADGINEHTIQEQQKEIRELRTSLAKMAARLDAAEREQADLRQLLKLQEYEMVELRRLSLRVVT